MEAPVSVEPKLSLLAALKRAKPRFPFKRRASSCVLEHLVVHLSTPFASKQKDDSTLK